MFVLADIALLVAALYDCVTTDPTAVRGLPKLIWVALILLFAPVGGIMWFVAGRSETHQATAGPGLIRMPGDGHPSGRRSLAPDDDPDFLRDLSLRTRQADEERLRKWEADLRAREERLRRDETPPTD